MKRLINIILVIFVILSFVACAKVESTDNAVAVCSNGKFIGKTEEETGVLSFKGIPYAKAPVGNLRWKAPEPVDKSDETYEAYEFGKSSIQYKWFSEDIRTEVSEDCLTLNVWTNDLKETNKPVMVFFHGGAFAWGGTSEPAGRGETWDILYSEMIAKGTFQAYPDDTRIYFDTLPQQNGLPDDDRKSAYFATYDYAVDEGYIAGTKDNDYKDSCHEEILGIGYI